MRLTLLSLFSSTALISAAQVPTNFFMSFDIVETLMIDSMYPGDGWQIGRPDKVVFDSAYSAPNALVTDTLLPYDVGGRSHAEFHIPVNYYGEMVFLGFRHRMDFESTEAFGWLEYFEQATQAWTRFPGFGQWGDQDIMPGDTQYFGSGVISDSGVVYTGATSDWTNEQCEFICIALYEEEGDRVGGPDTMRFRFVFEASANINGRDGWIIDDVYLENAGACSGIGERTLTALQLMPNPASDHVLIPDDYRWRGELDVEVLSGEGLYVQRVRDLGSGAMRLDISSLAAGVYTLMVRSGPELAVGRLIIIR